MDTIRGTTKDGKLRFVRTELGIEKLCARCKEYWPLDFYHRCGDGTHSYCKACVTERCYELRHGAVRLIAPRERNNTEKENI